MALIVCPHCGKQVSDTVERCIHCGEFIKEKPPEPKRYEKLSFSEREACVTEFEKVYPKFNFRRLQRRGRRLWVVFALIFLLSLLFCVGCIFMMIHSKKELDEYLQTHGIHTSGPLGEYEYKNYWIEYTDTDIILWTQEEHEERFKLMDKGLIFALVGGGTHFLVTISGFFTILICYMKNTKKYLFHYKLYVKWLSEKKFITCHPDLSPRRTAIFDRIEIDQYNL